MAARRALVTGAVRLPHDAPSKGTATVYLRLLDVSHADAPARVVTERRLDNVPIGAGRSQPFELSLKSIDAKAHYVVDAHVDVDGDGRVGPGDYITMVSHPVLTFGRPDRVTVVVQRVS